MSPFRLVAALVAGVLLQACGGGNGGTTAAPTSTAINTAVTVPSNTATHAPTPAATNTAAPTPISTATQSQAATAMATPTSTPSTELVNVLQHHLHPSRDGLYVDAALTKAAAAGLHRDLTFSAQMSGPTYAQPLYVEGGSKALLIVATEQDNVYAFDAANGDVVWERNLGAPVALADLPCGNINPLGVTGTPIVDLASRVLYVDAMTTPDDGVTKRHLIHALAVDSGNPIDGWPVDVNATATFNGVAFDSTVQNQRGALQLLDGRLYVPFGGHAGDCGDFHGWVVGVSANDPTSVQSWATRARGGGAWAVSGVATDGASVYVATGNTFGAVTWSDGEAVIRLQPGPLFSLQTTDYFAPSNWPQLDAGDVDIGGTGPVLVEVPGATPSQLVVSLGKNGVAYLLDRSDLGGIGQQVASLRVASNPIINAAAAYHTAQGTYVVFKGAGVGCPGGASGDLTAIRIGTASPPTISVAWCASQNGQGSPIVTTSNGTDDAIVWGIGAEGAERLVGFDGDTGQVVYAGGGANELMAGVRRFETAIVARGRIFVAGDNNLYAFKP